MGARYDVKARDLKAQAAVRRRPAGRRVVVSAVGAAAEVVGKIEECVEITGVTNGQFSLIDILEHVLAEIGPADVCVSTWTMGIYDAERSEGFCRNGAIRRIRWLVDPSMFSRRPEVAGPLVKAFGVESFRAVNNHAKFATLVSDRFAVSIRSSMNLNPNNRLENFDITESPELAAFFNAIVDDVFSRLPAKAQDLTQSRSFFRDILKTFEAVEEQRDAFPGLALRSMRELAEGIGLD